LCDEKENDKRRNQKPTPLRKMKKAQALLLFCLSATLLAASVDAARPKWHELENYSFKQYVQDFGKDYSSDEYHVRQKLFETRLKEIKAHNADPSKTWKEGVNQFTDYTKDEFEALLGYDKRLAAIRKQYNQHRVSTVQYDPSTLPATVDWRAVTTPVKDQGKKKI
jgi:predicted DNA binding CopG/RHH family protein